jgi:hypothetical protein
VAVLLPTHDHAHSLELAARSVLEQTMGDLTLVVIGDGVGDDTRDVVATLTAQDERVVLVDRPKAPRHGEVLRHEVLSYVESPVVAYAGDDDLLLPRHLEVMLDVLDGHDLAHPLPLVVRPDGSLQHLATDLSRRECVDWHLSPARRNAVSLTGVVHTLSSYRRLPHGWRTTPPGEWTDHWMWKQFFALDDFRGVTATEATTVKLSGTMRETAGPEARESEIGAWWRRIHEPGFDEWWTTQVRAAVAATAVDLALLAAFHEDVAAARTIERDRLADLAAELTRVVEEREAERDQALAPAEVARPSTVRRLLGRLRD